MRKDTVRGSTKSSPKVAVLDVSMVKADPWPSSQSGMRVPSFFRLSVEA